MTTPRFVLVAAALFFAMAFTLSTSSLEARVAPAAPLGAVQRKAPAPAKAAAPKAEYVGTETCLGCHDDATKELGKTVHWKSSHPRSPAANMGCESCHGPGSRHIEDPGDDTSIRKFDKMAARDVSATCRTCHTASTHAMWEG